MASERERMVAGELYLAYDHELMRGRDVAAGVLAAGNPCRVIREL